MICKTCKFWGSENDRSDYGDCEKIEDSELIAPSNQKAIIKVSEGGSGWLETHRQFGCALWEKR